MNNLKEKLMRFMYGRTGLDKFSTVMIIGNLILIMMNFIFQSNLINKISLLLTVYIIYRVFSRNIVNRRRENEKFLMIWNKLIQYFKRTQRRLKEIKTHRYRRCPQCKNLLRLPRKTGKHTVVCPCCKNEFILKIYI